jgi:uncharacterized repeat protein (TIGR03803 family)
LIEVKGTLYGTTVSGGENNKGTVFSITTGGALQVLYSFKGRPDGEGPDAPLLAVGGKLYGTTFGGGANKKGTVFSITTSGTENVLFSFGADDGNDPSGGLIDVGGALYGTTQQGGDHTDCQHPGRDGCGTVFALSL